MDGTAPCPARMVTRTVIVMEYKGGDGGALLLYQSALAIHLDEETDTHANVARQHSMHVTSLVHVRDVQ